MRDQKPAIRKKIAETKDLDDGGNGRTDCRDRRIQDAVRDEEARRERKRWPRASAS